MRNLLVFFNNISALEPNRIAISIKERDITYLQLNRLVLAYAISLHNHGVTNKSCVALGIKSDFPSLLIIMATAYIGASWVQLTGSTVKNYKQLNVSHVLLEGAMKSPFNDVIPIKLDKSWFKVESPIDVNLLSLLHGNQSDDDVWMYAQSSGSTGTQKFMALSYANYYARTNKAGMTHDFNPVITANLFAPLTGPWVSYNLRTLKLGGTLVFGKDPLFWQQKNVQKVFGSPKQFDVVLDHFSNLQFRLPIAHIAGATVTRSFSERVFKYFDMIHNFYGGTEVGGIARNVLTHLPDDNHCVGFIFPENQLEIMDDDGNLLPVGKEGNIAIKNNILVSGYVGDSAATVKCFKNGWFFPGDIGYKDTENRLFLTGRISEVLNISGSKINISFLEDLVSSKKEVSDCAAFVKHFEDKPDQLMLLVSLNLGHNADQVIGHLAKTLLADPDISNKLTGIYYVDEIPRNQNGKILRNELAQLADGKNCYYLAKKS